MTKIALTVFLIIGVSLICLFIYLHTSQELIKYLDNLSSANPTAGLRLTIFYGIAKILSITVGTVITIKVIYGLVTIEKKPNNKI